VQGSSWDELRSIPGVGAGSVEVIEELLGHQLPREGTRRPPPPQAPWPEHLWRKRGLQVEAAITFAQEGMTVERLMSMTREELLGLRGVGPGTLRACELILGREIPSRAADPAEAFWKRKGVLPRAARALSQAGIRSLDDLRARSREDLFALRGLGDIALAQLEALLGSRIPSRADYWLARGLDVELAKALAREGIRSLDDLGRLTRERFLSFRSLGYFALRQCERLLGRRLPGAGGHKT
jgi:hypothetical protein